MNILFLLSCLEPSGSETYCVSLAKAWGDRHKVFWISDRLHYGQKYLSLPISQKAIPGGVRNTFAVARYVRENKIQVIHSHSRRAHWVAAQAALLTGIPHVTTIHQPLPVHIFSRLFPCLGDAAIAIDEVVAEHLQKKFHYPEDRLRLIRNGIEVEMSDWVVSHSPSKRDETGDKSEARKKRVLLLGRLTGGRWQAAMFFLETLKRCGASLPPSEFLVAGLVPDERRDEWDRMVQAVNQAMAPNTLSPVGFITNLQEYIARCDVVVGAGRSALESLAQEKLVLALGEGGLIGLCTADTWEECLSTNFGDHLQSKSFVSSKLEAALRQALHIDGLGVWGRHQVGTFYNIVDVAQSIHALYEQVCISRS